MTRKINRAFANDTHGHHIPQKVCRTCGASFFTNVGLDEHSRLGCHSSPAGVIVRRWTTGRVSPAGLRAQQERGRQIAAENNARRRRCNDCGMVSTCSGIGLHLRYSGHSGWADA